MASKRSAVARQRELASGLFSMESGVEEARRVSELAHIQERARAIRYYGGVERLSAATDEGLKEELELAFGVTKRTTFGGQLRRALAG